MIKSLKKGHIVIDEDILRINIALTFNQNKKKPKLQCWLHKLQKLTPPKLLFFNKTQTLENFNSFIPYSTL